MNDQSVSRRSEGGFTVIAILLLVSFMASVAATFSRSVIVDARSSVVSEAAQDSRDLLGSQLELVLQSQRVGRAVSALDVKSAMDAGAVGSTDSRLASAQPVVVLEAIATSEDRARIVTTVRDRAGLGASMLFEAGRVPAPLTTSPDQLPALDADVRNDVLGNRKLHRQDITTSTTLSGVDLEGVVVVHGSAVLTLTDVTLKGAIVSSTAATGSVGSIYSEVLAPRVVVSGPVRIEPCTELPGLAVLLPDGDLSMAGSSARLYIEGDVVAHGVDLAGEGCLDGQLVTVEEPSLADSFERPGVGREPRAWSSVLDHHDAWTTTFVALVPRELTLADVSAITSFTLPVRTSSTPVEIDTSVKGKGKGTVK